MSAKTSAALAELKDFVHKMPASYTRLHLLEMIAALEAAPSSGAAKKDELVFLGPLPGESFESALAVNKKALGLESSSTTGGLAEAVAKIEAEYRFVVSFYRSETVALYGNKYLGGIAFALKALKEQTGGSQG